MSSSKAQQVDPREAGLRGLNLKQPLFDADAVARADSALNSMGAAFEAWLDADVNKLQAARQEAVRAHWTNETLAALMAVSHDLKGMGGTYGYELVSDIAASLCRLIETDAGLRPPRGRSPPS
ncbi:MAG: Hpt domain-containing protein [Hyphomonadaceae bacterium]